MRTDPTRRGESASSPAADLLKVAMAWLWALHYLHVCPDRAWVCFCHADGAAGVPQSSHCKHCESFSPPGKLGDTQADRQKVLRTCTEAAATCKDTPDSKQGNASQNLHTTQCCYSNRPVLRRRWAPWMRFIM